MRGAEAKVMNEVRNEMMNEKRRGLRTELWSSQALKKWKENGREPRVLAMKGGETGHQSQMHQRSQIR